MLLYSLLLCEQWHALFGVYVPAKGLLMLVNSNQMPMPFVVDLAALASRRGYLKLDKWLHDRMRDQQVRDLNTYFSLIRLLFHF